jgi:hypothetical protein
MAAQLRLALSAVLLSARLLDRRPSVIITANQITMRIRAIARATAVVTPRGKKLAMGTETFVFDAFVSATNHQSE